jgi:hypothetical protein
MLVTPHRLLAPALTLRPSLVVPAPAVPSTISTIPAFSATAGTIYCEFTLSSTAGTQVIWSLDDATMNERFSVRSLTGSLAALSLDGGVTQCSLALGALSTDTLYRAAFTWSANDFAACLNGGTVATDTAGTLATVNRITVGFRLVSSDPMSGTVGVLKYWPYRIPNKSLPTLR